MNAAPIDAARPTRPTERFHWSGRSLMIYSERLPIKYLLSNHGLCLGVDSARRSMLFLACREGLFVRFRPVGDTVVEDLDYEIPEIARALRADDRRTTERG
jgi:hypothetical protein